MMTLDAIGVGQPNKEVTWDGKTFKTPVEGQVKVSFNKLA